VPVAGSTTPPSPGSPRAGRATRSKAARSTPYRPTRGGQADVGQDLPGPGCGLDHEPLPAPAGPQLAGGEPGDRHVRLLQERQQAPGHGGLADPRAALQQQPRGSLIHDVNLADRHGRSRGDPTIWERWMARIDHYEFGRIMIDGRQETKDLIILPDRVVRNWWRQDGHALVLDDLGEVLEELPSHLVVGTGADGRMRPDPDTIRRLQERGMTVEALPTGQAVRRFGELDPVRTAAALHLTC